MRCRWLAPFLSLSLVAAFAAAAERPAVDGAEPGVWTMDLDAARQVAAQKKLPLLLNFTGSDWCGWCKLMDKQVFSQGAWAAYAKDHVMLVWLDFPKDKSLVPEKYAARNLALSKQYGVEGYPSYVVLDDDGATPLGQLGADRECTPESFIGKLKAALENRASTVEALLKTLPAASAQEYRTTAKQLGEARAELKAWIATEPDRSEENQKKFAAWQSEISGLEQELHGLLEP